MNPSLQPTPQFSFRIEGKSKRSRARAGSIATVHGEILTPAFMPVGTAGSVKALSPEDLLEAGVQIILGNTYHLYLRPGDGVIAKLGGLHRFMGWDRPILTDSGGYQVSSLGHFLKEAPAGLRKARISEEGVMFSSHLDGSQHFLTPERSIQIQHNLGADLITAFDEATPALGKRYAKEAMERTHRWLRRSITTWRELCLSDSGAGNQALFGIIQGGNYRELRRQSTAFVVEQDLPGIAIGGASIGKDPEETRENVEWVADLIPSDRPLYLMGVGVNPRDLIVAVEVGADLVDCVAPTRLARMGHLYHGRLTGRRDSREVESEFHRGRLNIANARFKTDTLPIQEDCDCVTCRSGFTRSYLRHLFLSHELLYYRLASIHNLRFMVRLMAALRRSILA